MHCNTLFPTYTKDNGNDIVPPVQNRCFGIKNRKDVVHRGSWGKRATWQTTNRKKEGRREKREEECEHFAYHHQPLTIPCVVAISLLTRQWWSKHLWQRLILNWKTAPTASPASTSMSTKCLQAFFSPNDHDLCCGLAQQVDKLHTAIHLLPRSRMGERFKKI